MAIVASNQATLSTPATMNTATGSAGRPRRATSTATAAHTTPPATARATTGADPGRTHEPTAAAVSFRLDKGLSAEVPRPSPVALPPAATLRASQAATGIPPAARNVAADRIRARQPSARARSTTAPTGNSTIEA